MEMIWINFNIEVIDDTVQKELHKLSNLKYVFNSASINQKQEFLRMGLDSQFYDQSGVYRTYSKKKTGLLVRPGGGDQQKVEPDLGITEQNLHFESLL